MLGAVRTREEEEDAGMQSPPRKGGKNGKDNEGDDKGRKNSTNTIRKGGMVLLDTRTLPKVTSRTLTTKHPGMNAFEDSISVH